MSRQTLSSAFPFLAALSALAAPPAIAQISAPLPAVSQSPAPAEKIVSLDVANSDLPTVVRTLERETRLKVQIRSGPIPFHQIYAHVEDAPLAKALQAIADSAGTTLTRNADGSYLFGPEEGESVPVPDSEPVPREKIVSSTPGPRQVQVVAAFALADAEGVDSLGFKPDSRPLPASPGSDEKRLLYATGRQAAQLLQSLSLKHAVITSPEIVTANNVQAMYGIKTDIPRTSEQRVPDAIQGFSIRQETRFLPFQCQVTLTPRINDDGSVTLNFTAKVGGASSPTATRIVASGDTLVLIGWQVQEGQNGRTFTLGLPPAGSGVHGKPDKGEELLLFLTPTIIADGTGHGRADTNGGSPSLKFPPWRQGVQLMPGFAVRRPWAFSAPRVGLPTASRR